MFYMYMYVTNICLITGHTSTDIGSYDLAHIVRLLEFIAMSWEKRGLHVKFIQRPSICTTISSEHNSSHILDRFGLFSQNVSHHVI